MSRAGDRRTEPREAYSNGRLPPAARIRPGTPVIVVNLSASGALVESRLRCKPGSRCDLVVSTGQGREQALPARVTRCFVARLTATVVRYRTALVFEQRFALPEDARLTTGYELPAAPTPAGGVRVATSRPPHHAAPKARGARGERP